MFQQKYNILLIHLSVWVLMVFFPLLFFSQGIDNQPFYQFILSPYYWLFFFIYALIFYLNTFYLIPTFYFQHRYWLFFGLSIGLLGVIFLAQPFENLVAKKLSPPRQQSFIPPPPPRDRFLPPPQEKDRPFSPPPRNVRIDIISLFLYATVWALGLALKINERWRLSEKKIIQSESEKLNAELSFLKAQINPHFLFNTLNNIYTLALLNHPNTAPSIMKLSQIMRYVTDEVAADWVPLKDEIEFIGYYIDLEKLRLNEQAPVVFEVKGDCTSKLIPPLILITFVENAFKHGISKRELSPISIQLVISDQKIEFFCVNKFFENIQKSERVGIGLENTRQRLNQLYPQRHSLQTKVENGNYIVYLSLEI